MISAMTIFTKLLGSFVSIFAPVVAAVGALTTRVMVVFVAAVVDFFVVDLAAAAFCVVFFVAIVPPYVLLRLIIPQQLRVHGILKLWEF